MPPKKVTTGKSSAKTPYKKVEYDYVWLTPVKPGSVDVFAFITPSGYKTQNCETYDVQRYLDEGWSALEYKGFGLLMARKKRGAPFEIEDEE